MPTNRSRPTVIPIDPNWKSDFLGWNPEQCYDWLMSETPDYVHPDRFLIIDEDLRDGAFQYCVNWNGWEIDEMKREEWDATDEDQYTKSGDPDYDPVDGDIEKVLRGFR